MSFFYFFLNFFAEIFGSLSKDPYLYNVIKNDDMNKLSDLCDMIDALDIPESQKYTMRMAAASVENAGMREGYKIGFTAGVKEGRELEAMRHLPHNK